MRHYTTNLITSTIQFYINNSLYIWSIKEAKTIILIVKEVSEYWPLNSLKPLKLMKWPKIFL